MKQMDNVIIADNKAFVKEPEKVKEITIMYYPESKKVLMMTKKTIKTKYGKMVCHPVTSVKMDVDLRMTINKETGEQFKPVDPSLLVFTFRDEKVENLVAALSLFSARRTNTIKMMYKAQNNSGLVANAGISQEKFKFIINGKIAICAWNEYKDQYGMILNSVRPQIDLLDQFNALNSEVIEEVEKKTADKVESETIEKINEDCLTAIEMKYSN